MADPDRPDPAALDELYDEYLDATLRGDVQEPEAFCRSRGVDSDELRALLEGVYGMVAGPPERPEQPSSGRSELPAEDDLPFERLGEFRLIRRLGEGGMGVVYLAEQESLGRLVAVKVIRPELAASPTAAVRFQREAQAIARVRHPNIVGVHGFGNEKSVNYMAMELVPGRSLSEVLAEGPVPIPRMVRWARQIADALECAHGEGIVHRDVKPSNIRITAGGDAMLLDFGLARIVDSSAVSLTKSFAGSPSYASPEQISAEHGDVAPATDVYSLGATLYEGITGRPPFVEDSMPRLMHRILSDEPPRPRSLNAEVPRDLEVVVLKAMEKAPERRYADAASFRDDLGAVLELRAIRARPPGRVEVAVLWVRRHRTVAAALAAAVVVALGVGLFLFVDAGVRRRADEREARRLVARAGEILESHHELRSAGEQAKLAIDKLTRASGTRRLTDAETAELWRHQTALDAYGRGDESVAQALELLTEAAQLAPDADGLRDAMALYYYQRFLDVREHQDLGQRLSYRDAVQRVDPDGMWGAKVEGKSKLSIESTPPGAEVFLFAVRDLEQLVDGGEHRWIPWTAFGPDPELEPGAWALRVVAGAGPLVPNDLVLSVAGHPIEGSLLAAGGLGDVAAFDRLLSVDGVPVRDAYEQAALEGAGSSEHAYLFATAGGGEREVRGASLKELGLEVLDPRALAERGRVPAKVWRHGEIAELVLPGGLSVRTTAAPLPISRERSYGRTPIEPHLFAPGAYVALLRLEGHEDQRISFHIDHATEEFGGDLALDATLHTNGTTPPGFVYVPVAAYGWGEASFWMQEHEVTSAQYLEFLNDPATLAEVDGSPTPIRVPRYPIGPVAGKPWPRANGRFELPAGVAGDVPVLGVSWHDAAAYARWRGERDGRDYRLPSEQGWKWAGFGGDWREFVFGQRFSPRWVKCRYSRERPGPEPVMSYPVDESPLGIFDLAGSASEWRLGTTAEAGPGTRAVAGGSWKAHAWDAFKVGSERAVAPDSAETGFGFRLVLPDGER